MKKVLFVCLALVLALVSTGVAYSMWSSNLTIDGVVDTGSVDVQIVRQASNDPSPHGDPSDPTSYFTGSLDPSAYGNWWCSTEQWFDTPRWDKNVASIDCELDQIDGQWLRVTVDNGYPGYYGAIFFVVRNNGSIPVKLASLTLESLSYDGSSIVPIDEATAVQAPYRMATGSPPPFVYVDDEVNGQIGEVNTVATGDDAYAISLDGEGCGFHLGSQIEPGQEIKAQIVVRVMQQAQQDSTFDFQIGMQFAQWNEVP